MYSWEFKIDIFFHDPGVSYPSVRAMLTFKYSRASNLRIMVYYDEGGNDIFYQSSTGGVYKTKTFNLDAYKSVWCIVLDTTHLTSQQKLWVDYLMVGYENFYF